MHIITSVAKDKKGNISHVQLKSGTILTNEDAASFYVSGAEFIVEDPDGNQADVLLVKQSMRSKKNKLSSDNLDNLPLFEVSYE